VLVIDKIGDQLSARERVGFVGGHRAADALSGGDLGNSGSGGQRPGDTGKARFTAERGFGARDE